MKNMINKIKETYIRKGQSNTRNILSEADRLRIETMFNDMEAIPEHSLYRPSRYWIELNKMNVVQLQEHGFENIRRTLALNYCTWVRILPWDSQIRFLVGKLGLRTTVACLWRALKSGRQEYYSKINFIQSFLYNSITHLMWSFLSKSVSDPKFVNLMEPEIGNPPLVLTKEKRRVSQDIINAIFEVKTVADNTDYKFNTVLELGAGYGRNAHVFLKTLPKGKYIIADIPPALWVSERYLSMVFPEKKVFRYRHFDSFADVAKEFAEADLVFLLPHQIELLPAGLCDLIVNISSLHEMRMDQIANYLAQFDRLLQEDGHVYLKQWKEAHVLFEDVVIKRHEYPYSKSWKAVLNREASIQTNFFEAIYKKRSYAIET